jgi:hypothetical protein
MIVFVLLRNQVVLGNLITIVKTIKRDEIRVIIKERTGK